MASTSDGKGYWLVAADGGVFAYGDAAFAGSMGGTHLNAPIVGIAGNGDGGYCWWPPTAACSPTASAAFHGSAGALRLVSPVVGIAALTNGSGYYLVAADGGVFAYGSAPFLGSALRHRRLARWSASPAGPTVGTRWPLRSVAPTPSAPGYFGSPGSTPTTAPIIGIAS